MLIRSVLTSLFFMITLVVFSQKQTGADLYCGFNRIGVFINAGTAFIWDQHRLNTGLRYYGPDYVFETNFPGLSLGYAYTFSDGKWCFGPALNAAIFYEHKNASRLLLTDLMLSQKLGYQLGSQVVVHSGLGLGGVINYSKTEFINKAVVMSYLNYEFSLGITYTWNRAADN